MKSIVWLMYDWNANQYREANDLYGGIGYYRTVQPSRPLRKYFNIEVVGAEFKRWGVEGDKTFASKYQRFEQYDLIISKHILDEATASNLLATSKHFKKKLIVDIDDNYFDLRADNPALKHYALGEKGRGVLGAFLRLCDGMTVSTEPLRKLYLNLNKNVDVLPNTLDLLEFPPARKINDGLIRIGYAGGSAHNDDLDLIIEPIARILDKYPNTTFEIMGAVLPEKAMDMGAKMMKFARSKILERFRIGGATQAWQGYPEALASLGWDIGLAPLVDEPFNRGKSHIKWLEYSALKIPTIASPVYPYMEPVEGVKVIEHGKTGLLAATAEDWFNHLETLVENETYRKELGQNAYDFVKANWQPKQWALKWKKVFNKYL